MLKAGEQIAIGGDSVLLARSTRNEDLSLFSKSEVLIEDTPVRIPNDTLFGYKHSIIKKGATISFSPTEGEGHYEVDAGTKLGKLDATEIKVAFSCPQGARTE